MLTRNLLLKFSSLMLAGSMLAGVPAIIPAAQAAGGAAAAQTVAINGWAPARPAAGMGSIVFLNSFGSGAPLTIDLQKGNLEAMRADKKSTHEFIVSSDDLYTVPEATNSGMGRLQLPLAPGSYDYTASVPNIGTVNGRFEVTAGQVMGLSFYGGGAKTIEHNHSDAGKNDEHTTRSTVFTKLLVAPQDLTAQVR